MRKTGRATALATQQERITLTDLGTEPVKPQGKHELRVGTAHRAAIVLGHLDPVFVEAKGGTRQVVKCNISILTHKERASMALQGVEGLQKPQIYIFEAVKAT